MNHIYLHTSNLKHTRTLKEDPSFQPPFEYGAYELQHTHRNEYGRIKTPTTYYHILIGQILQHNCPWCGEWPVIQDITKENLHNTPINCKKLCLECPKCQSRGPSFIMTEGLDESCTHRIISYMKDRYQTRIPWDYKLKESMEPTA